MQAPHEQRALVMLDPEGSFKLVLNKLQTASKRNEVIGQMEEMDASTIKFLLSIAAWRRSPAQQKKAEALKVVAQFVEPGSICEVRFLSPEVRKKLLSRKGANNARFFQDAITESLVFLAQRSALEKILA